MPQASTLAERIEALKPAWKLYLPDTPPPHVTVIQLHGCGGRKPFQLTWGEVAHKAGAAVLVVDSHAHRRISEMNAYATVCTGMQLPGRERAGDLFAAMAWVRAQSWADPNRIIVAGWSHGGWTISDALSFRTHPEMERATGITDIKGEPLEGLVGLFLVYPYLGAGVLMGRDWRLTPRVHAIIGGRDVVAAAPFIRQKLARAKANGCDVTIVDFPTAVHAFDEPDVRIAKPFIFSEKYTARAHGLYTDFIRSF